MRIERRVHFARGARARKVLREGSWKPTPSGRIPRISRLMALAIHMQQLLDTSEVSTYAQLAELGHVSRARVSQIMKLNFLAPDIQEQLLFFPRVEQGSETITERRIRVIAKEPGWQSQKKIFSLLLFQNIEIGKLLN